MHKKSGSKAAFFVIVSWMMVSHSGWKALPRVGMGFPKHGLSSGLFLGSTVSSAC